MRVTLAPRRTTTTASAVVLLIVLDGCVFGGEGSEVATDQVRIPEVTAAALPLLPEGIEETTIVITHGAFDVESVLLQEGEPTVLHVVNTDDRAYRLRIGEDLVTFTMIAAGTTTDVKFTTPNANSYDGHLLAAEGDEVVDTVRVRVQSPGGLQP
jgi:hypothetical protein